MTGKAGMTPDGDSQDSRMEGAAPAPAAAPAEPATPRALWPTFMRRTLDEDALRPAASAPAPTR